MISGVLWLGSLARSQKPGGIYMNGMQTLILVDVNFLKTFRWGIRCRSCKAQVIVAANLQQVGISDI